MGAAVKNVHHRARQEIRGGIGGIARKIFVERLLKRNPSGAGGGHGDGEDGVCAEAGLRGRTVKRNHFVIERALVRGIEAIDGFGDFIVGVGHGLKHAFAEIFRCIAVAELEGFVLAGGSAGRAPPSRMTSASTVGLPRESMTWRARTLTIFVDMSVYSPE